MEKLSNGKDFLCSNCKNWLHCFDSLGSMPALKVYFGINGCMLKYIPEKEDGL